MRLFGRRDRTVYGCGNCRETFPTREAQQAHMPCPLVEIEREIAVHNRRAMQRLRELEYEQ